MAKKAKSTKNEDIAALENVEEVIKMINTKYGDGSLQYGDTSIIVPCESITTGAPSLDAALGVGGVPRGRVVELYGPESSGKTTLALTIVAGAQKAGGRAAFIDAEHALDKYWARNIGVDISKLVISQPDSGDQALEICETLVRSGQFDVVVVDSVAALTPQCEIDGEMGDANIGAQARLISKAMRKLCAIVHNTDTCVLFINQIRNKIGVMFGNPEVTPGGKALKFYAAVRMEIRKTTVIKTGDTSIGQEVKVKIVKNKVAPPFEEAYFKIYFGKPEQKPVPTYGVDTMDSLISMALAADIVEKSGSWLNYGEIKLGQGPGMASKLLRETPDLCAEIQKKVTDAIKSKQVVPCAPQDKSIDDAGFDDDEEADIEEEDTTEEVE